MSDTDCCTHAWVVTFTRKIKTDEYEIRICGKCKMAQTRKAGDVEWVKRNPMDN